jgi:high-affinity iron transporter
MTATSLITMRETLEASLVVGIVLTYLLRTDNRRHVKFVWLGVAAGITASVLLAMSFYLYAGELTGTSEQIYEGSMMLVAAGLLTWMILWMIRQGSHMRRTIEGEVATHVERDHALGIFSLAFFGTAREGVETVIFLQAAILHAKAGSHLIGFLLGLGVALLLTYCLFKGFSVLPLRKFFAVSSVLLLLFGAGLVAHGIHEFNEAGILPPLIEHVWDMNGLVHENSTVGQFLKSIFGYNGNPSLLEVLGYGLYVLAIAGIWRRQAASR